MKKKPYESKQKPTELQQNGLRRAKMNQEEKALKIIMEMPR